ncbi:hypothetical protein IFM53868_05068 [Aspergillus udagawae]|uniref:Lovastatin nonaketide synthase n=1 Tax=Aspergillus udagawae TaxID=91492 RepID=A0ABQ1ASD8_9EURO|nr:hypothetical protein IFM53868_05068 [Aspergillus udagawae]
MPSKDSEDILTPLAVVGLSFKFPQNASSPQGFWDMLEAGRSASTVFPASRMNIDAHYHQDRSRLDAISVRGGHFMTEDLGAFDAPFFGISVSEAQAMDPQQRLALETVYRAFENSGLSLADIAGSKTSVIAGSFCDDYHILQVKDPLETSQHDASGNARNMISNRVSWFFDLRGPSITLDTACSSSLVALDMVCQTIWGGDAKMGVAVGSNIIIVPEMTMGLDNLGLLSPDSRSYSFDDRANGYARGEGVGAVVVRPLQDAIDNGDTVRAVIRSSSSNQDGKTPGILQPSKDAQVRLIRDTYAKAGLDMAMTRYFEAHGTGTPVGDPIETRAIGAAFRKYRSKDEPLYVGSVKSNIGHLEGASGIAGVIKVILALENGIIPPNSENLQNLNPQIDEEFFNLKILKNAIQWPTNGLRRASVSSFGFGGANCHIVLDDAYNSLCLRGIASVCHQTAVVPSLQDEDSILVNGTSDDCQSKPEEDHALLVWSSADEGAIKRTQDSWRAYLSGITVPDSKRNEFLHNLAHTLAARRSHLTWRTFAVADHTEGLQNLANNVQPAVKSRGSPKLAYIFTGQGAQWYAMGRELIERYEVFSQSLAEAGNYIKELGCAWDLLDELRKPMSDSNVDDPSFGQPLCTALQIALVDLLSSWNVVPAAVIGHSSGEIAAAYSSGALLKHSAMKVAYFRGFLAGELGKISDTKGAMLAVGLSQFNVGPYFKKVSETSGPLRLVVACVNSPKNITVSGESEQIEYLERLLTEDDIFSRKLVVNVAYHSFQMEEVAARYEAVLGNLEFPYPRLKRRPTMISSVTGKLIHRDELASPAYWVRNMVSPVLFADALRNLCIQPANQTKKIDGSHRHTVRVNHLLEIGPHSALQGPCKDILKAANMDKNIGYIASLRRNYSAVRSVLECVGHLHCEGYPVNVSLANLSSKKQGRVLVDLPEYPFNHDTSYWHESRHSKNFRFRNTGRLDLLGIKDVDGNPMEAHWRNIISVGNLPWVKDHKINNEILYPAAGMVVMAVEAIKQLVDVNRRVSGFSVKDCKFLSPIRIATNAQGIETSFHMKRVKLDKSDTTGWYDFRVCSYDKETWTENCTGSIQATYESSEAGLDCNEHEDVKWQGHLSKNYHDIAQRCTVSIDPAQFYKDLIPNGYQYGHSFAAIIGLSTNQIDSKELVSTIRTFRGSSPDNSDFIQPHTIHPTTLDAIIHTMTAMTVKTGAQRRVVALPMRIEELWICNSGALSHSAADTVEAYACTEGSTVTESRYSMAVFDKDIKQSLLTLDGLRVAEVENILVPEKEDAWVTEDLCHHVYWKPDVDLFGPKEVDAFFPKSGVGSMDTIQLCEKIELLASIYIGRIPKSLIEQARTRSPPHMVRYIDWLAKQQDAIRFRLSSSSSLGWKAYMEDEQLLSGLHDELHGGTKRSRLASTVGKNLSKFISGDADPISLYSVPKIDQIARYIDALGHKNPQMKILELGAGSGALTDLCLRTLNTDDDGNRARVPRYSQWDFTDISSSFFPQAQSLFADYERMRFMALDIEKDPEIQGFERGTYDLVAAYLVFHATVDLTVSLKNARKLLKPGGKLLFIEITKPGALVTDLIFGLFDGWWRGSESYRQSGPCVDEVKWGELLQYSGFSGCDIVMHDYDDDRCHETSMIVSTAVNDYQSQNPKGVDIILNPLSQKQIQLASKIGECLLKAGIEQVTHVPMIEGLSEKLSPEKFHISLLEVEHPFLYGMNRDEFQRLHDLIIRTNNLLWVNGGGGLQPCPKFRLGDGLFRVVIEEDPSTMLCILSLERSSCLDHQSKQIVKVLLAMMEDSDRMADTEYTEIGGLLHVGRLVNASSINQKVTLRKTPQQTLMGEYGAGPPLCLQIGTRGLLNTLHFIEDKSLQQHLGHNEIEIRAEAVGLNFRDVLTALGRLDSRTLGGEFAGEVVRVGHSCERFQPGDRVVAYYPSNFANYVRVQEDMAVIKIPNNLLSFEDAAAIPVAYGTAWLTLNRIAKLQPGESVLVHSGAGGTGQAAIQVAQYLGATVFTTVSSLTKKSFLIHEYGIPEERIFSSRNTLFVKGIRLLTGGKGVDVVLNSLSSDGLVASWECVAPYGRFVEIGKHDILSNTKLPMAQFMKNVSFNAFDLAAMMQDRPQLLVTALQEILSLIEAGKLSPSNSVQVYGISEIEQAFRHMQSGRNIGKTVLKLRPTDQVTTIVDTKPTYLFNADSTYVIAGGLGGLGRSIAHWLVNRGARNLILLSRSGNKNVYATKITGDLQEKGATVVTPSCDITDRTALASTLETYSRTMPPIKGCVQATMVISKSSHFGALTYESWWASTAPKAQGSWNLHELLPQGLDFFILLSSVAGISGARGDSGYAAGNTFLDGLARYRTGIGEKAVSLDLGLFLSAGCLHENKQAREYFLSNNVLRPLSESDLHALLDIYCNHSLKSLPMEKSQTVVGITPIVQEKGAGTTDWLQRPFARHIKMSGLGGSSVSKGGKTNFAELFASAKSLEEVSCVIAQSMKTKLSRMLSISADELDLDKPIHQYGVDSLTAVELRNWFAREMRADVAIFDILGGTSIASVVALAAGRSEYCLLNQAK